MRTEHNSLFLVHSSAMSGGRFKTGAIIPRSGIYRVYHSAHRLPHEVTLLRDQTFPKCQKCADAVTFELRSELADNALARFSWHVALYELPVLDDDAASATGG